MRYTTLGNTGLEVSRLCLGTMNFGSGKRPTYRDDWTIDEAASREVMDQAIENGINFIDTANIYSTGDSERIVGNAIADYDRDELVIATKVRGEMRTGPNGRGLSRKHVLDQADASLSRLGVDYIDLYQIHRWDDQTPIEETLSALDYLVDEGVVRYIGASSMASWKFSRALYTSDIENYERFVSMQPEYSLARRHEEENIGVVPWSPLYRGFLTGKYERTGNPPENSRMAQEDISPADEFSDELWKVLDVVREIANDHGVTPVQVSLAWLLHKDVITAPIIGPKAPSQLDDALGALDVSLSVAEIERLEAPIDPVWSSDEL